MLKKKIFSWCCFCYCRWHTNARISWSSDLIFFQDENVMCACKKRYFLVFLWFDFPSSVTGPQMPVPLCRTIYNFLCVFLSIFNDNFTPQSNLYKKNFNLIKLNCSWVAKVCAHANFMIESVISSFGLDSFLDLLWWWSDGNGMKKNSKSSSFIFSLLIFICTCVSSSSHIRLTWVLLPNQHNIN